MANVNPILSVITLNVNVLNSSIKSRERQNGFRIKDYMSSTYYICILNSKKQIGQSKRTEKDTACQK